MDITKEQSQREEFLHILFDLARNQVSLKDSSALDKMYRRLEALYNSPVSDEKFRHYYSDIFSVLTMIEENPQLGDINVLGQNMSLLMMCYQPEKNKDSSGKPIDISNSIKKLYDHINLDIARLVYISGHCSGQQSIIELKTQTNALKNELKAAQEEQIELRDKLDKQQRDYTAILGVFAAVVLTFTAAIGFSTSVFDNIDKASIYRIVLISLITGLVLINMLFGLFYYVDRMVHKIDRIRPLLISNFVILALIVCTVFAWYSGLVEERNERFTNSTTQVTVVSDTNQIS